MTPTKIAFPSDEGDEGEVRRLVDAAFLDASMDADGDLRVSDESGESYLYPADRFVPIDVPEAVGRSMTAQC